MKHRRPTRALSDDDSRTQFVRAVAGMIIENSDPAIMPSHHADMLRSWTFYVTDTTCGRARLRGRTITIPLWLYDDAIRHQEYGHGATLDAATIYYISHELAHAVGIYEPLHGPRFMKRFKGICPEYLHHMELSYKPRNAAAAGIANK